MLARTSSRGRSDAAKPVRLMKNDCLIERIDHRFYECFPYVCPEPVLAK
jgi:hypothetical protein